MVAEKYDVAKYIQYDTLVSECEYLNETRSWVTRTNRGEFESKYLLMAAGALSEPVTPDIPGIDSFSGNVFHSARWDHDFDLEKKNIAVIGTGASSIQFVPQIAEKVGKLSVFQRTPPWIIPRNDKSHSKFKQALYKYVPGLMRLNRWKIHWINEMSALGTVVDPKYMKIAKAEALKHINRQIEDDDLRQKVTPDYIMGCKRILISNDWYPALLKKSTLW